MFGVDDAALAIIAAGAISSAGALYANKKNIQNQQYLNDLALAQSDSNNALQIDLANTAHQREIRDLRAAGLNPILSAGGSGSAVPSLQQARMDAAQVQNPLSGLANSAGQISRYFGQSYKADLESKLADVRNKELEGEILDNTSVMTGYERNASEQKADLEGLQALIEKKAIEDLAIDKVKIGRRWVQVVRPNSEYFKKFKEGLMSDQVIKARQSSRNLYQDILSGVNSAERFGSMILGVRRPSKWLRR